MSVLAKFLRWLRDRRLSTPPFEELPIAPPRYASRLTGEDFSRYDPRVQAEAKRRGEALDVLRARLTRAESSGLAPLAEAPRKRA